MPRQVGPRFTPRPLQYDFGHFELASGEFVDLVDGELHFLPRDQYTISERALRGHASRYGGPRGLWFVAHVVRTFEREVLGVEIAFSSDAEVLDELRTQFTPPPLKYDFAEFPDGQDGTMSLLDGAVYALERGVDYDEGHDTFRSWVTRYADRHELVVRYYPLLNDSGDDQIGWELALASEPGQLAPERDTPQIDLTVAGLPPRHVRDDRDAQTDDERAQEADWQALGAPGSPDDPDADDLVAHDDVVDAPAASDAPDGDPS